MSKVGQQPMKRVLILEPYFGGSHKLFLEGIQKTVEAVFVLMTLPARKWKMRMQFSAIWFVQQIQELPVSERNFDAVLCSTFVDVAVFRALSAGIAGWNAEAVVKTYFHENQFAYPSQQKDISMRQFTSINCSTALASDGCAFNSRFNRDSFLQGVGQVIKFAADMKISSCANDILEKSVVLYPGMDYSFIDSISRGVADGGSPVIVWNHRWEHDKGPEIFFAALYCLQEKGVAFRLIVLGESYANMPACFAEAEKRLAEEIIHFGYAESRQNYAELLHQGDVLVSTAKHEFFGIAVLEGIRAGCYPLLPKSLSYPELYGDEFLYASGNLVAKLEEYLCNPVTMEKKTILRLTERFSWPLCKDEYTQWLFEKPLEKI